MLSDEYKTISGPAEGFFKDKGSKFYSFAFPVMNLDDISKNRQELRKKYFDARHHVYAYKIGFDDNNSMSSDDGEPSNSSGPPILGQIRSFELSNILIVVVRYFGGTKLGVPGLINAYRTAASDAIKNAVIVLKTNQQTIKIGFEYALINTVMKIVKELNISILEQDFGLDCKIVLSIRESDYEKVFAIFKNIFGINIIQHI